MVDTTAVAIEVDELRLAQLACAKLARILQGTISVGLPGIVTGVPDPQAFLETQLELMAAYARVLHSVAGTPGGQEELRRLRERSRAVLAALASLRRDLSDCLDASPRSTPSLRLARDSASALCDALREYGSLVHVESSQFQEVKGIVLQVFDGVEDMISGCVKSVG